MKVAVYLDEVSNSIDNSMQWAIMSKLSRSLAGVELIVIDPIKIGKYESTEILLKQDYDVLLTYNKTGTNLRIDYDGQYRSVLSLIKRKHIAWLTEHPLTFYDQYYNSPCDRHYIFPNESHGLFAGAMGLVGAYSVQMFGSQPIMQVPSYAAREYDVCIAAQWRGSEKENAFWLHSKGKTREFFEDILYLQDSLENRDTFTAFIIAAKHHGVPEQEIVNSASAMRAMYWYARKKERINLVRDFAKSGLKIALIGGQAWKSVLEQHDNIHFIEPVHHDELQNWYLNSKSVVTMNNFNGANERVFDSMAAGALLFSENAPSLVEMLGTSQALFYEPNKAGERIEELCQTLQGAQGRYMAEAARHTFECAHTWQHRGAYLTALFSNLVESAKA
jgi:hypothetical protein